MRRKDRTKIERKRERESSTKFSAVDVFLIQ